MFPVTKIITLETQTSSEAASVQHISCDHFCWPAILDLSLFTHFSPRPALSLHAGHTVLTLALRFFVIMTKVPISHVDDLTSHVKHGRLYRTIFFRRGGFVTVCPCGVHNFIFSSAAGLCGCSGQDRVHECINVEKRARCAAPRAVSQVSPENP
ncbi:hypothetical protein M514_11836 [Trichuris suis]|uniref:Uncharacterized protein n=2 Tax=Trichuris suis TaxID=68888 RepID=A0A085MTU2_9BILA|nr:hypothetical protein M514_11836 [Trichuris suis]